MAEQLMQMAGPGAQLFIDGFRGGRLPPKDQIQQIRFHTNSYAAEYHEAGMVRIEVITRPGMGGWRGNFNFGFRDESLNARNAFATEKGPEQQKRFMFSFQGPIAKGKTSLSIAADGNMAYDAQTIVARTPTGEINDQVRRPDRWRERQRARSSMRSGPTSSLRAEYSRRDNTRGNLGVGDFDLAGARLRDRDDQRQAARAQHADDRQESLQRAALRVHAIASWPNISGVARADRPRARRVHVGWRRSAGRARGPAVHGRAELRLHDREARAAGGRARSMAAGGTATTQTNANGTFTFSSLDDYLRRTAAARITRRVGDPNVSYSQFEAGWYIQDDFRVEQERSTSASASVRRCRRNVDDKWNLGAARGVHAGR